MDKCTETLKLQLEAKNTQNLDADNCILTQQKERINSSQPGQYLQPIQNAEENLK